LRLANIVLEHWLWQVRYGSVTRMDRAKGYNRRRHSDSLLEDIAMKRAMLWMAAAIVCGCLGQTRARGAEGDNFPTILVSGTAEIRVVPDEVNLRLAVETRDPKLDEAVKQNDTRIAAVLKFLKDAGIAAKDVQTDYVEIQPRYHRDDDVQQIVPEFYIVRRNLGIRLRKVAQFDTVLAGTLRNGVNYVLGIEFRTTELRKHRDAARQQAIRAAKEKATALAEELGSKVGKPQTINEQTGGGWWGWSGGANYNAMIQNVSQAAPGGGGEGDGNLSVGMINVTATVQVTFRLE
jgi:uncharacterized protein YggE